MLLELEGKLDHELTWRCIVYSSGTSLTDRPIPEEFCPADEILGALRRTEARKDAKLMHHLLFGTNTTPYKTALRPAEEFIALARMVEARFEGDLSRGGVRAIEEIRQRGAAMLAKNGKVQNETKLLNLFVTSRSLREALTSVSKKRSSVYGVDYLTPVLFLDLRVSASILEPLFRTSHRMVPNASRRSRGGQSSGIRPRARNWG